MGKLTNPKGTTVHVEDGSALEAKLIAQGWKKPVKPRSKPKDDLL